jgi:ABC-type branched-subunit amino acid transport system substrate-binding protein
MRNRLSRGVAMVAASTLSIGLATTGIAVSSAGATGTDPGVNTSTKTLTIGATAPLSGIAKPGYSDVAKAANAVFKYMNAKGGVNTWKVNFIIKDDCYGILGVFGCTSTAGTEAQTRDLVENQNVFATVGSLGTATQDSVRNYLDTNGVPQLFVNSGSKDWDHPATWPKLFGFQPSYLVEGKILANYVKTHFKGQKVGVIGQHDDFGTDGLQGLLNGGLTIDSADRLTYEATDIAFNASAFKTSVAKLQASKVKVVVLDTVPPATKLILDDAKKLGYKPQFVISGVGADPQTVNTDNEKNALSFTFLPASKDTTNPWNAWIKKVLLADKTDFPTLTSKSVITANMQYGAAWGVAFLQVLKQLNGATPTRQSVVAAMLTQNGFVTPALVPLDYTSSNHQGLNGGYIIKISSKTDTMVADKQIYTTGDGPLSTSPLVKVTGKIAPIPTWLK